MNGGVRRVTEAQVRRELLRFEDQDSRRRGRIAAIVALVVALLVGAAAARFLFVLADVRGDGMADAVRPGDVALCVRVDAPALGRPVARGDLALVKYADNGLTRRAIRRAVAVGGDVVDMDQTGRLTLNGVPADEPYAVYRAGNGDSDGNVAPGGALVNPFAGAQPAASPEEAPADRRLDDVEYPLTVPDGMLFVLCDDRENLLDSRSSRFGLVSVDDVEGLARAVVWPVYRAGRLPDASR